MSFGSLGAIADRFFQASAENLAFLSIQMDIANAAVRIRAANNCIEEFIRSSLGVEGGDSDPGPVIDDDNLAEAYRLAPD